jgi:hypothetical protein
MKIDYNFCNNDRSAFSHLTTNEFIFVRPRPLWKVKRNKHRKHYSDSDESDSDSTTTSETSTSESSNNSSAKTSRSSDFNEIYEFTCPLSPPPKNNEADKTNADDNTDKTSDDAARCSSTSSRDSGFHGGTAPSSPKKALGEFKSYKVVRKRQLQRNEATVLVEKKI